MPQPNLLFIYTDEQAASTMAAYGNNLIETPNLDRLARRSVVFTQAFVSQAVCSPSRSSILTGLYPHASGCTENNILLPEHVKCLPELADFSGYRSGHFGKWHLGDEIFPQHGFHEWISTEGYRNHYRPARDRNAHPTYYYWLVERGFHPQEGSDGFQAFSRDFCARLPEEFGKPAYLASEASRFIREHQNRPFILYVNFLEPHMPFFGPRDHQYHPARVPLPPNFHALPGPEQPLKLRLAVHYHRKHGTSGLPLASEADWRRLIANYWGLCSLVDTHVGRILDTLAECGLQESTIVVFTSDHGDMMGSHGLVAKCTQYQEAVRVPLLLRVPGLKGGPRPVTCPVSQLDLVPTLLDLLGQPLPSHLQGRSWRPGLQGDSPFPEGDVLIEWNGPNSGMGDLVGRSTLQETGMEMASVEAALASITDPVRTIVTREGWKLNCSPLGEHELYNLHQDPGEMRNLIRDPGARTLIQDLYHRILAWQSRVDDPADLSKCRFP